MASEFPVCAENVPVADEQGIQHSTQLQFFHKYVLLSKWGTRFLFAFVVVSCACSLGQLYIIVPYLNLQVYTHLEKFNQHTAKISALRVYDEHECDLMQLKQFDKAFKSIGVIEAVLSIFSILELALVCLQCAFRKHRTYWRTAVGLIFFILFLIHLIEIVIYLISIPAISEKFEPELTVSDLLSSAADKNTDGFEAIQEFFSCKGFRMTKITKKETCTQKLQAKIMDIKNYKFIFIGLLLLKQVFFFIVIANYVWQICNKKEQVYEPVAISGERNGVQVPTQCSGLSAESIALKLEQMVDEERGRDAEIMELVQIDYGKGDLAAVTHKKDCAELPE